jgi:hypothetical protein
MLVAIVAEEELVHEPHEVESFALNFGRRVLQRVHVHLIGHQMGIAELLQRHCAVKLFSWNLVKERVDGVPLFA